MRRAGLSASAELLVIYSCWSMILVYPCHLATCLCCMKKAGTRFTLKKLNHTSYFRMNVRSVGRLLCGPLCNCRITDWPFPSRTSICPFAPFTRIIPEQKVVETPILVEIFPLRCVTDTSFWTERSTLKVKPGDCSK